MDTNKTKPTEQQTNKSVRWKLPEFRKHVVKKCMEGVIMESGVPLARLSGLVPFLERFEAKVHASAKNEAEYIQWLSEKVKEITSRLKSSETKPRPSNSTGSAEILSVQEAGKSANTEWKEQVYQKAQRMNSAYFPKVSAIYQQMRKKLQELESSPQELNKVNLERMRNHKKIVENILAILRVSKCQITIDFKEKLDKAEKLIVENLIPKNASSRHQGQQHSTDVQSRQQSSPSHSSVSQMKMLETKPSPQALGKLNYHMVEDISQQNRMCLQEQQVAKQFSNSQQDVHQLSIIKGAGNTICHQGQQHAVAVQSRQKSGPSHSSVSQMKMLETKPSPQALGKLNYHMIEDASKQNKMRLQEQQVAKQYSNSQQDVKQLSIIKGTGNAICHQGQQHSVDVQSRQKYSSVSTVKILETKPSPQALGKLNYHMIEDVSKQNKMCLQEQQVAKQYSNSEQNVKQLSIIKGMGETVQQQTQGAQKATEAFSVSVKSQEISGSPLIENCNKLKEISHKPTVTSDEPSAAMQRFLKVLTSISPEALSASVGEIRDAVYLNDVTPSSELINGPPNMVQQLNQPHVIPQTGAYLASDIEPCSQARYITCNDFVPTGRKRSRSINAVTTFDTSSIYASSCDSNQLTNAKKPNLTSVTSKIKKPRIVEKCSLLVEIKEINNLLIDSEIVIGEKDSTPTAAGGATEHGEGLVIKLLFNAVTFNQNLTSHLSADKKSIIKPLWLLVPANYPYCPPVILEKMPLEVRSDQGLKDLSTIAKSNLRLSLQRLNQPWSLRGIAMLWERCAREAILEYAQCIGGGTFSSIHGGWKMCPNYA